MHAPTGLALWAHGLTGRGGTILSPTHLWTPDSTGVTAVVAGHRAIDGGRVRVVHAMMHRPHDRRAMNLLSHRRFRAAYDLMLLRVAVGEVEQEYADFWTEVRTMSMQEQRKIFGLTGRRRGAPSNRRSSNAAP